ncbi:MAG: hypothetical protein ABI402_00135 [Ferruginibacter sp.]
MKAYKLVFMFIVMLLMNISFAKSQVKSVPQAPDFSKQKKCCPDTGSLVSGLPNDFNNSDLAIEKPKIVKDAAGNYTFTASVVDNGDDCAYCSKIIILLPAEVTVISATAYAKGRKFTISRCLGIITIEAGMLCPGEEETKEYGHRINITVKTSDHSANTTEASFGIVAYSKIPDLHMENNYWSGKR